MEKPADAHGSRSQSASREGLNKNGNNPQECSCWGRDAFPGGWAIIFSLLVEVIKKWSRLETGTFLGRCLAYGGMFSYALAILVGLLTGLGTFTFGYAEGASYLKVDPTACINC